MIQSMTGYSNTAYIFGEKKIFIEIKTLNSKNLDINLKISSHQYKELEYDIRKNLTNSLSRGKIDCSIIVEESTVDEKKSFNENIFKKYYLDIKNICDNLNIEIPNNIVGEILKMPDVSTTKEITLSEDEIDIFNENFQATIQKCIDFRREEGNILRKTIISNINSILELLNDVPKYEAERITLIKERISQNIAEFSKDISIEDSRLEQELFFYIEKLDINEEKVRLKKHCDYFLESINDGDACGKKITFICQEIGREINTLGSKANHFDIQKIVVKMKEELEKVKEQIANIL